MSTGRGDAGLQLVAEDDGATSLAPPTSGAPAPAPVPKKEPRGKKRKERKGMLWCAGCGENYPVEMFHLQQSLHKECKLFLDRIYGQCKTQGKLDWFQKERSTEKGTKAMLDYYRKLLSNCGELTKSPKFAVAQYQEQHRYEQETAWTGHGTMMWERQAVEFWMTAAGGSRSAEEAQAKWDHWSANYKDMKIIHDFLSPNPSKPLRLRVPTGDTVDFKNSSIDSKIVNKTENAVKRPKVDDIDKMKARASMGFDAMGNGAGISGRQELAQQMVSAGSGEAFDGPGMLLQDITVLGSTAEESDDGAAAASKTEAAESASAAGPGVQSSIDEIVTEKKKKQKKWVDIEKEINAARRSLRTGATTLQHHFSNVSREISKGLATIESFPLQAQKLAEGEVLLSQTRMKTVELVMGDTEVELASFLRAFLTSETVAPGAASTAAADDSSSALATRKIGKAPPCADYQNLRVLSSLVDIIGDLDSCQDTDQIKEVCAKFTAAKAPFLSLISACKTAVSDLKQAQKLMHGCSRDGIGAVPKSNIFEHGPAKGVEVPILKQDGVEDWTKVDYGIPFLMEMEKSKHTTFLEDVVVRDHLADFRALFSKNEKNVRMKSDGRSHCKSTDSAQEAFVRYVKAAIPNACVEAAALKSTAKDKLADHLEAKTFGMTHGHDSSGVEKLHLPCFRLTCSGTRRALLTRSDTLRAFMVAKSGQQDQVANVGAMKEFFNKMGEELMEKYIQAGNTIYHCTIGQGVLMYVPAGFFFAERTGTTEHVYGFRVGTIANDRAVEERLECFAVSPGGEALKATVEAYVKAAAEIFKPQE